MPGPDSRAVCALVVLRADEFLDESLAVRPCNPRIAAAESFGAAVGVSMHRGLPSPNGALLVEHHSRTICF